MDLRLLKKSIYPIFLLMVAYLLFFNNDAKVIVAGISIFLIGMLYMEDGFKLFSGGKLETILEASTNNIIKAISTGFITTALVQSSSLISIIIISFLSVELISLKGAVGVIFGSNIGTTTTAWIISTFGIKINIIYYAMPILTFGVIFRFNKNKTYQGLGSILIGLGFVFLGISYMKDGFETLKNALDLAQFAIEGSMGIFIYILIGAFATVIIQSSSATMALIITALSANQIIYINALELAIGANIGTTVTAVIATIASSANGKRLAVAHFIFNIITAFIAIVFLYQLEDFVSFLSFKVGIADNNYAMQLALFHTVFNMIGLIVVTPFYNILVRYLGGLFIDEQEKDISRAKYLDNVVIEVPEAAILALKKEIIHLYDNATEVLSHALSLHRHTFIGIGDEISTVVKSSVKKIDVNVDDVYEKKIKSLYGDIIDYATVSEETMCIENKHKMYTLKIACRDIVEAIKEVKELQKNVNRFIRSTNVHIKDEYNYLRENIASTLDGIHALKKINDDFEVLAKIEILKESLNNLDMVGNGRIDTLIRTHKIETKMATSLINDSTYAYNISKKLISAAAVLWINDTEIQDLGED